MEVRAIARSAGAYRYRHGRRSAACQCMYVWRLRKKKLLHVRQGCTTCTRTEQAASRRAPQPQHTHTLTHTHDLLSYLAPHLSSLGQCSHHRTAHTPSRTPYLRPSGRRRCPPSRRTAPHRRPLLPEPRMGESRTRVGCCCCCCSCSCLCLCLCRRRQARHAALLTTKGRPSSRGFLL